MREPEGYADIALDGLIKALALEDAPALDTLPPGYEALTKAEARVLGLLWRRAKARQVADLTPEQDATPGTEAFSSRDAEGTETLETGTGSTGEEPPDNENLDAAFEDAFETAAASTGAETEDETDAVDTHGADRSTADDTNIETGEAKASDTVTTSGNVEDGSTDATAAGPSDAPVDRSTDDPTEAMFTEEAQTETAGADTDRLEEATSSDPARSDAQTDGTADSDRPALEPGGTAGRIEAKDGKTPSADPDPKTRTNHPSPADAAKTSFDFTENPHRGKEEFPDMARIATRGPKVSSPRREQERVNLRNGKARQDYAARIEGYTDLKLRDDGGSGLTVTQNGKVSGSGMNAGDYKLKLGGLRAGRPVEIQARVSIIPDPRDLWKTLPSDRDDPHWKKDEDFRRAATDDALVVAASKRGRSHAQEGLFRDDDFSIRAKRAGDWHYLIVADGAGSARLSREGSKIACQTALDSLSRRAAEAWPEMEAALFAEADGDTAPEDTLAPLFVPVLTGAAADAAKAIETRAAGLERNPNEFLTTLVVALTRRVADRWLTATFSVGDGGVAIYDTEAETVRVLCQPDSGEFAGQTRFLSLDDFETDPADLARRVFVDIRPGFTVLAAMTDGITDPKFPTDAVFAQAETWAAFWTDDLGKEVDLRADNPELECQMLAWLDFWSKGNHDDRTLAILVPADKG